MSLAFQEAFSKVTKAANEKLAYAVRDMCRAVFSDEMDEWKKRNAVDVHIHQNFRDGLDPGKVAEAFRRDLLTIAEKRAEGRSPDTEDGKLLHALVHAYWSFDDSKFNWRGLARELLVKMRRKDRHKIPDVLPVDAVASGDARVKVAQEVSSGDRHDLYVGERHAMVVMLAEFALPEEHHARTLERLLNELRNRRTGRPPHEDVEAKSSKLADELCRVLSDFVGETGLSEGAVDVLTRLAAELREFRKLREKFDRLTLVADAAERARRNGALVIGLEVVENLLKESKIPSVFDWEGACKERDELKKEVASRDSKLRLAEAKAGTYKRLADSYRELLESYG